MNPPPPPRPSTLRERWSSRCLCLFTTQLEAFRQALKADGAAKKSAEAKQLAALRRAEEAKVATEKKAVAIVIV